MQAQNFSNPVHNTPKERQDWWRFGFVWLVILGPVSALVAAVITWQIAMGVPDPVVKIELQRAAGALGDPSLPHAPALEIRNHWASPESVRRNINAPAAAQTGAQNHTGLPQ